MAKQKQIKGKQQRRTKTKQKQSNTNAKAKQHINKTNTKEQPSKRKPRTNQKQSKSKSEAKPKARTQQGGKPGATEHKGPGTKTNCARARVQASTQASTQASNFEALHEFCVGVSFCLMLDLILVKLDAKLDPTSLNPPDSYWFPVGIFLLRLLLSCSASWSEALSNTCMQSQATISSCKGN